MPYVLGIDIGVSTTTAAVCRRPAGPAWRAPEVVALDPTTPALPSVLRLTPNGQFIPGEADGPAAGDTLARGFPRRVGDDAPLVVGGESYWAHALVAALARWVVDAIWEREEAPAERVAISYPTGWGGYRVGLLDQALREAGLADVALVPRARAVVESHDAAGSLRTTGLLAAYRLGGTTTEAALVARSGAGSYELVSWAELDDLGGADILDPSPAEARSAVLATTDLLAWTIRSGGAAPGDVTAVLLAGGAATAPLVADLIAEALPVPVLLDDDPQFTVAKGAAAVARRALTGEPPAPAGAPSAGQPQWSAATDRHGLLAGGPSRELVPADALLPFHTRAADGLPPSTDLVPTSALLPSEALVPAEDLLPASLQGRGPRARPAPADRPARPPVRVAPMEEGGR